MDYGWARNIARHPGQFIQILLISQFFTIANSTAGQIAYGVDKHKSVATWAAIEAALNLSLSIVLVKTVGLYGVAWGTSLSQALIHLIFWPRFVRREFGVPVQDFSMGRLGKGHSVFDPLRHRIRRSR